jgi:hypothetical protein
MKKLIAGILILGCLPWAALAQYEELDWSTKKKIAFYLPTDDVSSIKPKDFKKIDGSYELEWKATNVLGAMSEKGRTMWGPSGYVNVTFDSFDRDYAWILKEAKEKLLEKKEVEADIANSKKSHADFLEFEVYVNCCDEDVWDIREENYWRMWLLDDNEERVYPLEIVKYEGYPDVSKRIEKVGLMGVEYKYTYYYAGFLVKFPNFYGERRPDTIKLIMAGELGQHGFEWIFDKSPK